jgi:hypothetical protein
MEGAMPRFRIYDNGSYWVTVEAADAEEAIQIAADEHGYIDAEAEHAPIVGLTAVPAGEDEEEPERE